MYGDVATTAQPVGVESRLDRRVQALLSLIFDKNMMEQSLLEMEIDLKKMPLGKLSKRHIQSGYEVLKKIEAVLQQHGENPSGAGLTRLIALCNEFYTRIPHDFGHEQPPVITTRDMLKAKIDMMEAFINIEIATSLMKVDAGATNALDASYDKLQCSLEALDRSSPEFQMAQQFCDNQRGSYALRVTDVFKVARNNEQQRFQAHLGNRQLLWHGSRTTNYVGILSQGLRIAPPEAPCSGYRFGKGIYMADVCEKSASYCRSSGSDTILMMLCEAALGKPCELKQDKYMEKPQPGFDSTKALGGVAPDPAATMKLPSACASGDCSSDVQVPLGKPINTGIKSACTHNEYIVYDVSQVVIRYLLRIQIK